MRPRTLAILAAVVAALAAFIYFYERELPSSEQRRERSGRALPFEAADLTALTIEWQGATVRLEREPAAVKAEKSGDDAATAVPAASGWRLIAPLAARADRSMVERLAGDLSRLEVQRTLEGAERKDVGLEPPRGRVLWRTATAEGTFEIGGQVPASQNLVAAASTRTGLFVIPGWFVADLGKPAGEWRAREVIDVPREAIERIRLAPAAGGEVVLARSGEAFAVEAPFRDVADRDLVEPLLGDLTALRAAKFLDPPLAPDAGAPLAAQAGRIELGVEDRKEPLVVEIGGEVAAGGNRVLRTGELAFEAATKLASALTRAPGDWRAKSWTSFDSYRVEKIRIDDAQGKTELARAGADWQRDGQKVPYPEVGDLLYALTSARADRVLAGAEAEANPVAAPTLTVTLVDGNGVEETLTLHPGGPEGVPARASGRHVILLLPGRVADEVTGKIAALRAVQPLSAESPADGERTPAADADPE